MKFPRIEHCGACGFPIEIIARGGEDWPHTACPSCGDLVPLLEPNAISVVADRLFARSADEIRGGDFTLAILCAAIAAECLTTSTFMKWKEIEHGDILTDAVRADFEEDYRYRTRKGFFQASDVIAQFLTKKDFEEFSKLHSKGKEKVSRADIQHDLFDRRNRIAHWGEVGYSREDAMHALEAARAYMSLVRKMDLVRYDMLK